MRNFWMLFIFSILFFALVGCGDKDGGSNTQVILVGHVGCIVLNVDQYCASVSGTDLNIYFNSGYFYSTPPMPDFTLTASGQGVSNGVYTFTYSTATAPTGKAYLIIGKD